MKSLLNSSLRYLAIGCLVAACGIENTVYHSYAPLPQQGWAKRDTLRFRLSLADSCIAPLQLYAEVRNRREYPYQDLHLLVCHNLSDSTRWQTDTVVVHLTDSTGRQLGKGLSHLYQSAVCFRTLPPPVPGQYGFKIVSGMRDELLPGLQDIGIRVELAIP